MALFLTTLSLTLALLVGAALVINFCKRRTARTRHGLTGMCHESGGTMCCSCTSQLQQTIPDGKDVSA